MQSGKRTVSLGIRSLDLAIHGPALCLSATKALWGFLPYPWPDSSVDPWRSSRQLGFCRMPEMLVSASSIHCSYAYALLHSLESCLSGRSKTRGQWNANSPVEVSTGDGISGAILRPLSVNWRLTLGSLGEMSVSLGSLSWTHSHVLMD